jgi:hypothetical protein
MKILMKILGSSVLKDGAMKNVVWLHTLFSVTFSDVLCIKTLVVTSDTFCDVN